MRLFWSVLFTAPLFLASGCNSSESGDEAIYDAGSGSAQAADAQAAVPDTGSPAADAGTSPEGSLDGGEVSTDSGLDAASSPTAEAGQDAASQDAAATTSDAGTDSGLMDATADLDGAADAGSDDDASQVDAALASDANSDGATDDDATTTDASTDDAGAQQAVPPYAVGTLRVELTISADRTVPVQLWYPAVEAARSEALSGHPTAEFEPEGARRDQLIEMLANSPDACTNKTMHAALAPEVFSRSAPYPALVFSHCQDCVRFSTFTAAEHLASQGFVVAAPDHVNGTIYDGTGILDEAFLEVRANDARKVIDMLLDAENEAMPVGLRGKIDASHVGMFGHSYGSLTTGRVLRDDMRVKAGSLIAAPIDLGSPLDAVLPSAAKVAELKQPSLFFEGLEDSSLFTLFIDDNFDRYAGPTWEVKVKDAGHWSFTDIAGFNGTFESGCGTGTRQGSLFQTFTYVDIVRARDLTKAYLAAFFQSQLLGNAEGSKYLESATPADLVTIEHRN